jgi:aminoglycoside/choline kinase family phosphotransferase
MWLADRPGIRAIGLIDFQDALIGPTAYDLVSLLQDARTRVPADLEAALFASYVRARRASDPAFDKGRFREAYAISSAQRALRILGIFTRLRDRDGKPGYIRLIPQLKDYLTRTLTHPVLAELDHWLGERDLFEPTATATPAARAAAERGAKPAGDRRPARDCAFGERRG